MATAVRLGFAVALLTLVTPASAAAPASGTFGFDSMTFLGSALAEARDATVLLGREGGGPATVVLGRADAATLPDGRLVRAATLTFDAGPGSSLRIVTATGAVVEATGGTLSSANDAVVVHADATRAAANGALRLVLLSGSVGFEGDRSVVVHRDPAGEAPVIELGDAALDATLGEGWYARLASSAVTLDVDGTVRLFRASGQWAGEPVGGTFQRDGTVRLQARFVERRDPASGAADTDSGPGSSRLPGGLDVALPGRVLNPGSSSRTAGAATADDARLSATLSDAAPATASASPAPPLSAAKIALLTVLGVAFLAALKKANAFSLLAALGSKIRGDEARRHPARERILALLRAHPGMRLAELERELAMTRNTIEYHLLLLKRCGQIEVQARYGSTRYFLRGHGALPETQLAQVVLRRARLSGEILRAVEERPGVTVSEVAERLEMHPSHTMYHLRKLLAARLVDARKEGRTRRLYPFGHLANGGITAQGPSGPGGATGAGG